MKLREELSEKERELFIALGHENYLDIYEPGAVISVYTILAMECFRDNRTGPEVDSLRRCVQAINNCKPYRSTKEFDDLILL